MAKKENEQVKKFDFKKSKRYLIESVVFSIFFIILLIMKVELYISLIFLIICIIFIIVFAYRLAKHKNDK